MSCVSLENTGIMKITQQEYFERNFITSIGRCKKKKSLHYLERSLLKTFSFFSEDDNNDLWNQFYV